MKYKATECIRSTLVQLWDVDLGLLAEIHKDVHGYRVRIVPGIGCFLMEDADNVKIYDTVEEAAEIVDAFLNCGAVNAVKNLMSDDMDSWRKHDTDI